LPGEPVLVTKQLTMRFGGLTAVGNLDLAVREHEIHSVIGPNGAGKTTVFNCIMQNIRPTSGQIWFRQERLDGLTPDRVAAVGIRRAHPKIPPVRDNTPVANPP